MTKLLQHLLHAYGLLYITIMELERTRPETNHASLKDYYESLGEIQLGEPAVLVRISKDGGMRIVNNFEDPGIPPELKGADVTLMEMPEDEFYFFRAFRYGILDLNKEVPGFILQMALTYSYSLFENYVSDVIRLRLRRHPAQLGLEKQVLVSDVIACDSKEELIEVVIDREVRRTMHEPIGLTLKRLRERLGLCSFAANDDEAIVKLSLIRNCLMHNGARADAKLAASDTAIQAGALISVTPEDVRSAISTFRRSASAIDEALEALE